MIDSRNATTIAVLLEVMTNFCTVPDDGDIIETTCLVDIGERVAHVLARVENWQRQSQQHQGHLDEISSPLLLFVVVLDLIMVQKPCSSVRGKLFSSSMKKF